MYYKKTLVVLTIVLGLLIVYTSSTKAELTAMDEFMDRLLQNATKTDEEKLEGHDWTTHLMLCKVQYQLDVDIGQRSLAILNGKNGFVRCPISQFWPADQSRYPQES